MDQAKMIKLGAAAAILFAGFKFGGTLGKAAAIAVGANIAAKQIPYLKDVV